MNPRVYLAGPDVFFRDAEAWAEHRKAICAEHGLVAVSPLDPLAEEAADWAELPEWQRIAWRNEAHIRSCDAVIANLTPFRGPSADAGTVYEVGFARALGRVVFGYTNSAVPFTQRTLDYASTHGGAIAQSRADLARRRRAADRAIPAVRQSDDRGRADRDRAGRWWCRRANRKIAGGICGRFEKCVGLAAVFLTSPAGSGRGRDAKRRG